VQATGAQTQVTPKQLAEELLAFWHNLMRGNPAELYRLLDALELSITHVKALHYLADSGPDLSVKEFADRIGMSLAGASRTVEALLRRGLLERREDQLDRRVKRVAITAAGRDVVTRIDEARLAGLADYTSRLTPEQRARLHAAFSDLPPCS
jgi:DNA-binding MarR family transcriptional regulator